MLLAQFPENTLHRNPFFFTEKSFDEHFAQSGVSDATIALVRKLCCSYRNCLYFSDLPAVLQQTPNYDERVRLIRALSRRATLLVNLRITPASDLNALAAHYWSPAGLGQGPHAHVEITRAKARRRPPGPHRTPAAAAHRAALQFSHARHCFHVVPRAARICHWSSFNFFRDPPDDRYSDPGFVSQQLQQEYDPAPAEPRYGDLVVFIKPSGEIIHSAVYLADNIVFTKNGAHYLQPWMLNTIADLLDTYSFQTPPDQPLTIKFYRKKV